MATRGSFVTKKRLDVLLVERGSGGVAHAGAGARARRARARPRASRASRSRDDAELEVERPPRFVSRGGEKLQNALDALGRRRRGSRLRGRRRVDGQASPTASLQAGAARVVAIDVGYGQLHPRLRSDPRVTVLERVNARALTELPFAPELVVCDVSFISVTKALPPVLRLARPGWEALVLVKPQFEAGRARWSKGVVRDPDVQRNVLETRHRSRARRGVA